MSTAPDQPAYCSACGTALAGARFCTHCGAPVPTAGPLPAAPTAAARRPGGRPSWLTAVLALLVVAIVVAAYPVLRLMGDDNATAGTGSTASPQASASSTPVPSAPSATTEPSTSAPTNPAPTSAAPSTSAPLTPEGALRLAPDAAAAELDTLVAEGRAVVAGLVDRWVPQVSSKCPGLSVDIAPNFTPDGHRETPSVTAPQILAFHLALAQRLGAVTTTAAELRVSEQPTTCIGQTLWVALVPHAFPSSDAVLAWCEAEGFPADECAARNLAPPGQPARPLVARS